MSDDDLHLAPEWVVWVVTNLLEGVHPTTVIRELTESGVPAPLAATEVARIRRDPVYKGIYAWATPRVQAHDVTKMRRDLGRKVAPPIERVADIDPETFYRRYYANNRPVILTDFCSRWPAIEKWRPEWFARFGDAEIEVVTGREDDERFDQNHDRHTTTTTMAEYVAAVVKAGTSNDIYMVARNATLTREPFGRLWDDVAIEDGWIDPNTDGRCASLWFGPAGTLTPLHHDTCNILFNQIVGRKRFTLIPPTELSALATLEGFYSRLDPENRAAHPDIWDTILSYDITLAPGETLFIPVGWLHHVRALDLSISFSLLRFVHKNDYAWYRPGESRRHGA